MSASVERLLESIGRSLPLILLGLLLPLPVGHAQEDGAFGEHWGVFGTLDRLSWSDLADVRPLGRGGPFETSGTGIELGGYASVARIGSVTVLAGMQLGLTGFNYDTIFDSDPKAESAIQLNYLSGAVRFRLGQAARYVDLELAVGSYTVDSKYIDCAIITSCFAAATSADATGVQFAVIGMVGKGVLLGARVHQVDFDPIEAIDLRATPLDGPVYSLFVGWEYGNWGRD